MCLYCNTAHPAPHSYRWQTSGCHCFLQQAVPNKPSGKQPGVGRGAILIRIWQYDTKVSGGVPGVQEATFALNGQEQKSQLVILDDNLYALLFHHHAGSGSKICFGFNQTPHWSEAQFQEGDNWCRMCNFSFCLLDSNFNLDQDFFFKKRSGTADWYWKQKSLMALLSNVAWQSLRAIQRLTCHWSCKHLVTETMTNLQR